MNSKFFYHDKPLFGLDIGFSTIKVMQSQLLGKDYEVVGYGVGAFDSKAIENGVIVDYKSIAGSITKLFKENIVGEINTRRIVLSVPASKTYTRTIELPSIKDEEIPDAVRIEAEQYIPIPLDELYLDHSIIKRSDKGVEVLAVATPKKIVDSHIKLAHILGLDPVGFDTSILAVARLFEKQDDDNNIPAVLVDFGSVSTDITIHDGTVTVTGTIPGGGDIFTESISKTLGVTTEEAHIIKTKYGMGKSKKQNQILGALQPTVDQLAKEIQRMIRYHEERSDSEKKIGQVITMGGGANMPGLSDYLTNIIRLPVRTCEPLSNFKLGRLRPPNNLEKSIYVTVAGLSLIDPKELFQS